MDDLPLLRLRRRVQELSGALNLRPTLDRAGELGGVLSEAKGLVGHDNWQRWLRSAGLSPRVAQLYMQVSKANPDSFSGLGERVTIRQFLGLIRRSRREGKAAERAEIRGRAASVKGRLPDSLSLKLGDCRRVRWPSSVDCIATDPPWKEDAAYQWLATFAARRLKPGGVLLVQCGVIDLPKRMQTFIDAGLMYQWTLAMAYTDKRAAGRIFGVWCPSWLPVLVFSQGKLRGHEKAADVYTVPANATAKSFHDWQQPLAPWVYWIERLVPPGALVCDPFAGAATIGVAVRDVGGGRRYLGTEIDPQSYRVARGRLLGGDKTEGG